MWFDPKRLTIFRIKRARLSILGHGLCRFSVSICSIDNKINMPEAHFIIIESHYDCSNVEILIWSRIIHFTSFLLLPRWFRSFTYFVLVVVIVVAFVQLFGLCFSHFFNAVSKRIASTLLCILCYQFIQHSNLNCKVSLRAKCFYANSLHFTAILLCLNCYFADFGFSHWIFAIFFIRNIFHVGKTHNNYIHSAIHTAIQSENFKANDIQSVLFYVLKAHERNCDYFFGWQNKRPTENTFFWKIWVSKNGSVTMLNCTITSTWHVKVCTPIYFDNLVRSQAKECFVQVPRGFEAKSFEKLQM